MQLFFWMVVAAFFNFSRLIADSLSQDLAQMDIMQVYESALDVSDTVFSQAEVTYQADQNEVIAWSTLFPQLNLVGTTLEQEIPKSEIGKQISPAVQNTVKVTASQNLFLGLKEYAGVRQLEAQTSAQRFTLLAQVRDLFFTVVAAYYAILQSESDVKSYQEELVIDRDRLAELERFYAIGRSKQSDVLSFKATVFALDATLETAKEQVALQRVVLNQLLGFRSAAKQLVRSWDESLGFQPVQTLNEFLQDMDKRFDIQSALQSVKASSEQRIIARAGHLPSVTVAADYYFQRPGVLSDVYWDATLNVNVPIFAGFSVVAQQRQAFSQLSAAERALNNARRVARQQIETYYASLVGDQAQWVQLKKTSEFSEGAYAATRNDFRKGLVTNLDVTTAFATWRDNYRAMKRMALQIEADKLSLVAAAHQNEELIQLITTKAGGFQDQTRRKIMDVIF